MRSEEEPCVRGMWDEPEQICDGPGRHAGILKSSIPHPPHLQVSPISSDPRRLLRILNMLPLLVWNFLALLAFPSLLI